MDKYEITSTLSFNINCLFPSFSGYIECTSQGSAVVGRPSTWFLPFVLGQRKMIRGSSAIVGAKKRKSNRSFPKEYEQTVAYESIKPKMKSIIAWVEDKTLEILGFEDDVLNGLIENYLTNSANQISIQAKTEAEKWLNPKELHTNLEQFLGEDQTNKFMPQLWSTLVKFADPNYKEAAEESKPGRSLSRSASAENYGRVCSRRRDQDRGRRSSRERSRYRRRSRSRDRYQRRDYPHERHSRSYSLDKERTEYSGEKRYRHDQEYRRGERRR